jgi:hypothetical protein
LRFLTGAAARGRRGAIVITKSRFAYRIAALENWLATRKIHAR